MKIKRSPSKLYWQVEYNGVVLSAGHSSKHQAQEVADKLTREYGALLVG